MCAKTAYTLCPTIKLPFVLPRFLLESFRLKAINRATIKDEEETEIKAWNRIKTTKKSNQIEKTNKGKSKKSENEI